MAKRCRLFPRLARTVAAAVVTLAVPAAWATPHDPASLPSLGASPFTAAGTYTVDTSATPPTMTPPGGSAIAGHVSSANAAVFVFNSVAIPGGATVLASGNRPFVLLSKSTFDLAPLGEINVSSSALSAGPGAQAAGPGTGGIPGDVNAGAGGGGFGGAGGRGGELTSGTAGAGGEIRGDLFTAVQAGARGGNATAAQGGLGGGAVELGAVGAMTIRGLVAADGAPGDDANGANGGAGGGSGGGILLNGQTVSLASALLARGGRGGDGATCCGGGGGGGGQILVLTASGAAGYTPSPVAVVTLFGGAGGAATTASGFGRTGNPGSFVVSTRPGPPLPVVGCIEINGDPLVNATVSFQQARTKAVTTTTNTLGCYSFPTAVSGRSGSVTIQLPPYTAP